MRAPFCFLFIFFFLGLQAQNVRVVNIRLNDVCYAPLTDKLYALAPGDLPQGNAVLVLDPVNGNLLNRIACGSEPVRIALSDNGQYLYIALRGTPRVRRYDLQSGTFSGDLVLEQYYASPYGSHYPIYAEQAVPLPGQAESVLVNKIDINSTPGYAGMGIFDGQTPRPDSLQPTLDGSKQVAVSNDGLYAWGVGQDYAPDAFNRYRLNAQGITLQNNYPGLITQGNARFSYKNDRIYVNTGQVFDLSGSGAPVLLATLNIGQDYGIGQAVVEAALDSAVLYFVNEFNPANPAVFDGFNLRLFSTITLTHIRDVKLPAAFTAKPGRMVSMGKGRVAMLANEYPHYSPYTQLVLFDEADCPAQDLNLGLQPAVLYGCHGDTLRIQAAPGYSEYTWSNGAVGQEAVLTASVAQLSYRVGGTNGCLSKSSDTISVLFEDRPGIPTVYISDDNVTLCPGETATVYAYGYTTTGTAPAYLYSNGDSIPAFQPFLTNVPGLYSVRAVNLHGCPSEKAPFELIPVAPGTVFPLNVEVDGSLNACSNSLTTLTASDGAWGYEWTNGANTRSIQPQWTGAFAVRELFENGCKSPWSDTFYVSVNYPPPPLTFSESYFTLTINNVWDVLDSVQWYWNGQPIAGANDLTFAPTQFGIYTVQNFANNCALAPPLLYSFTGECAGKITQQPLNTPTTQLYLQASATPQHDYTYLWFDGSKAPFIAVDQPGNYCVTITRPADSCVSVVCTDVVLNNRLYASVSAASQPQENMLVVLNEVVNYQLVPRDTLVSDVAGNVVFEQVVPGFYALQAIPPAGHPLADDFFPTYYIAGTLWQEAYQFPFGGLAADDQQPSSFDIALLPTQQFGGGPGVISGLVTQAPGFTVFPGSDGAGAASGQGPLSNVEMLLFSTSGQISMYTYTNANGQFSFSGLPYGTYYVYINLQGTPVVYAIVELTPSNTVVNGLAFTVTSTGASVGTGESMWNEVHIWPNPVKDLLFIEHNEAMRWTIYDALGKTLQSGNVLSGPRSQINTASWPAGMYIIELQSDHRQTAHLWFVKHD